MPDTASLVLIKDFQYRDKTEEFSNKYHFTGATPSTTAEWETLFFAWMQLEKKVFPSSVRYVRGYGYNPGSDHANFVIDLLIPPHTPEFGTMTPGASDHMAPGDAAATVRWSTGQYNSRGKLIYARKYFHAVYLTATDNDQVAAAQLAQLVTFGAAVISGSLPGAARYSGPQGAALQTARVDPYITTRTLKRRGKRPLP